MGGTWDVPSSLERNVGTLHYETAKRFFVDRVEQRLAMHSKFRIYKRAIGFKHPIASLLLPELSQVENLKVIEIHRDPEEIVSSLIRRKPRKKLSFFPGQYGFSQHSLSEERMFRLTEFYHDTLNQNKNLVDLKVHYNDLCFDFNRSEKREQLEDLLGREIVVPHNFFRRKSQIVPLTNGGRRG